MKQEKIQILDTTLRDGDQGTGTPFTWQEKVLVAQILQKARVDVIEGGFARSRVDSDSIKAVVKEVGTEKDSPIIASLSRANEKDIDASFEAVSKAENRRIHTFIATSDAHMKQKLGLSRPQVLKKIQESVSYAVSTGCEVEWSAEDATNSNREFLADCVIAAIESGATVINIPDTLGGASPLYVENLFKYLIAKTAYLKSGKQLIFSSHSHNDRGLALAGAIGAIRGGARQVETTILGIGERTGNTKFHELISCIHEQGKGGIKQGRHFTTGVDVSQIYPASALVSRIIGMSIHPNEPIIGSRTNSHGSGIHTDGAIKGMRNTGYDPYMIIDTSKYGNPGEIKTFNARGGAAEVQQMLEPFGIAIEKSDLDIVVTKCASEAEKARGIYPTMVYSMYLEEQKKFSIDTIEITDTSSVCITITLNGKQISMRGKASEDNGIIDATVKAINNHLGDEIITIDSLKTEDRESPTTLAQEFNPNTPSSTGKRDMTGSEKIGIVTIGIKGSQGEKIMTRHASHNVDESTIKAIIYGCIGYLTKGLSMNSEKSSIGNNPTSKIT